MVDVVLLFRMGILRGDRILFVVIMWFVVLVMILVRVLLFMFLLKEKVVL